MSTGNTEAIFIAKLNQDGVVSWAVQTAIGEFGRSAAFDMVSDQTGDLIFTGYIHREVGFQDTTLFSFDDSDDIFIAKYNSSGSKIWVKQAGGDYDDRAHGLAVDDAGNIYIVGEIWNTASFDNFSIASTENGYDMFIAMLNADGNFQWVKQSFGDHYEFANSISFNAEYGIAVCGSYSKEFIFDETVLKNNGDYDVFLAILSSSGDMLSAISIGNNGDEEALDVILTEDNYAYLIGTFQDTIRLENTQLVSNSLSDAFITKVNIEEIKNATILPRTGEKNQIHLFQNHPNPFVNKTVIDFLVHEKCRVLIKLFDVYGRQIGLINDDEYIRGTHSVMFDGSALSSDIYFYSIEYENYKTTKAMLKID